MLEVVCFDRRAGTLSDSPSGLGFAYDPAWVVGGGHPLSQSLPLSGDFGPAQVEAFFGGLLKIPIQGLQDTVANEALCLEIGRRLGIPTAQAHPRRAGDRECLLVARYDRAMSDGHTRRLHQEDFCQALGIPSDRKYEAEGGAAPSRRRLRALAQRAPVEARAVLAGAGWASDVLDAIVDVVEARAALLGELAA